MRRHKAKLWLALAIIAGTTVPSIASIHSSTTLGYVPNQLIVRLTSNANESYLREIAHASVIDRIPEINAELWTVPDPRAVANTLALAPGIASAEPNLIGHVAAAPPPSRANDPLVAGVGSTWMDRQWYLQRMNVAYAWAQWPRTYYTARSKPYDPTSSPKIAVLDTAIDFGHPDWYNAGGGSSSSYAGGQLDLKDQASFIPNDQIGGSKQWHGTFVAGLIAAAADNQQDIAGIAYAGQIMPITVANGEGATNGWLLAKGVTWAVDHGAKVINASLTITGSTNEVNALRNAINRAVSKGAIVIAAAGNSNSDDAQYPAGFSVENSGVMAVGASDIFDERDVQCSHKARYLSVLAPDEKIWSLTPHDPNNQNPHTTRQETCGTSFSTALVSGIAGLLVGKNPRMSPADIASRIEYTCDRSGTNRTDEMGWGRVNAERAVWSAGGPYAVWKQIPDAGPSNRVTVRAYAKSNSGVRDAEIIIDGNQRGHGNPRAHADSRHFSSQGGDLVATLDTSTNGLNLDEGPHEIAIRARDGNGTWGPAATGVLIVDRVAPTVDTPMTKPTTTPPVIDPDTKGSAIDFAARSTWSRTLHERVTIINAALQQVVQFDYPSLPANITYALTWSDVEKANNGPLLPGEYRVLVDAWNRGGMQANPYGDAPFVVLPSTRAVQPPGSSPSPGSSGPGGLGFETPRALPSVSPPPAAPSPSVPTPSVSPSH